MISDLGHKPAAQRICAAVTAVLTAKTAVTFDLGGDAGTQAMADAIIASLKN